MATFLLGLVILIGGGALYGTFCERVFGPDDRETPAYAKQDGVDFVPMATWRNCLINLLNIAGTGPILGPIQGILFGPIALITIPIGNVLGGSFHDYFCGMICCREGGLQMPEMIRKYTNKGVYAVYNVFVSVLLLLVGAVFVYTPGDIAATQLFGFSGAATDPKTWIIYAVIFIYYLIATVFPIDKIIGRVYPIFGIILVFSALGIFFAIIFRGLPLVNVWDSWTTSSFDYAAYFKAGHFVPIFFVTVACGILSGFHSTQTALISRTIKTEHEGHWTFYNMMMCEGFIAMCWAAGTMAMIQLTAKNGGIDYALNPETGVMSYFQNVNGQAVAISATSVVGVICKYCLGSIGGMIALIGVIILPITSGDTALRALRLQVADTFHMDQSTNGKRFALAIPIYALTLIILIWAKFDANGFQILWRYFAWSNQTMALFALASIMVWMIVNKKKAYIWMPMIPLAFYSVVCVSYICNAQIGFHLPWNVSYIISFIVAILLIVLAIRGGNKRLAAAEHELR